MVLRLRCNIASVERSYIPNILIWELSCGDVSIKMDIHKLIAIFRKGDNVEVTISKTLPDYRKGEDIVARGYVITKRDEGDLHKLLISLWGFLVVVSSRDPKIFEEFNPVDEVFMKISRAP